MDICIGVNLRQLRKAKGITQEELAECLGVSFQTISKWERGESYPDITLLPGIANFFSVTIDELMGMDRFDKQAHLGDVYKQSHQLEMANQYSEAIEILRKALKLFPNNYGLMSELSIALSSEEVRAEMGLSALDEAKLLSERVIENCTNDKIRSTTRANLCFIYHHMGEYQRAAALAKTLPHIWESREMLMPEIVAETEYIPSLVTCIRSVIAFLCIRLKNANIHGRHASWYQRILGTGLSDNENISISRDEIAKHISGLLELLP